MKIKPISILSLTLLATALCGCHYNDEINRDNPYSSGNHNSGSSGSNKENGEKSFTDIFGAVHQRHTWNQAITRNLDIKTAEGARMLRVYIDLYERCYILAQIESPKTNERLKLNVPSGVETLHVVVDGIEYVTTTDAVDATRGGVPVQRAEVYGKAEPLGWIYAADDGGDYDFNDAVFRIVPLPSGDVQITAMAIGTKSPIWLHYTNGSKDYIISPKSFNGYWLESKMADIYTASQYHGHNWFSEPDGLMSSGYEVNTLSISGANFFEGATVTIPAKEFEGVDINMQYICLSNIKVDEDRHDYAEPEMGFYVTRNVYHIPMLDKVNSVNGTKFEICKSILCQWPAGSEPSTILVADVSGCDTKDKHYGWRWPSEGSRIDMTYPMFLSWIKDPSVEWSIYEPSGWDDRQAEVTESGSFKYYGYYPR